MSMLFPPMEQDVTAETPAFMSGSACAAPDDPATIQLRLKLRLKILTSALVPDGTPITISVALATTMQTHRFHRAMFAACLTVSLYVPASLHAQNPTEWSTESRTILAFKVNPNALRARLPPGWESAPSTAPASTGANLNLTVMDRTIVLDGQGKPLRTGTSRCAVLTVPAKNAAGATNNIVIGGISPDGAGAYGVYLSATTAHLERTVTVDRDAHARVQETWDFAAQPGERISVRIVYQRGAVTKSHADTVVRSAIHPEFQRTYHIDQATDVVRGAGIPDRVERLDVAVSGPALASLFDGSQRVVCRLSG